MAYKPSMRRSGAILRNGTGYKARHESDGRVDSSLLAGTEMVKLSIIEINLPPASAGGGNKADEQNPDRENEKKLGLRIAIHNKIGIQVCNCFGSIARGEGRRSNCSR